MVFIEDVKTIMRLCKLHWKICLRWIYYLIYHHKNFLFLPSQELFIILMKDVKFLFNSISNVDHFRDIGILMSCVPTQNLFIGTLTPMLTGTLL